MPGKYSLTAALLVLCLASAALVAGCEADRRRGRGGGANNASEGEGEPCYTEQDRACTCGEYEGYQICDGERWSSCMCERDTPTECREEGALQWCSTGCTSGEGERECIDGFWSPCYCYDQQGCIETETQPCECWDGSEGYQECIDGMWRACELGCPGETNNGGPCPESETRPCECWDGSEGRQECWDGTWQACDIGCPSETTNNGQGCSPHAICYTYAEHMESCFDTGQDWVAECMNTFDICDIGGDGCDAPTPNLITCTLNTGCNYEDCLQNSCGI